MKYQTCRADILSVPTIPGSISFPLKTCTFLPEKSPSVGIGGGGKGLVKVEAEPMTFRFRVEERPVGSKGRKQPDCGDFTAYGAQMKLCVYFHAPLFSQFYSIIYYYCFFILHMKLFS